MVLFGGHMVTLGGHFSNDMNTINATSHYNYYLVNQCHIGLQLLPVKFTSNVTGY